MDFTIYKGENMIYLIFLLLWFVIYNSIKYNFKPGSKNIVIAYSSMWGLVLVYIIYKVIKYLKSEEK